MERLRALREAGPARLERFHDRAEAGRLLAAKLQAYAGRPGVLVLALPRGGVPVAFEVARSLSAQLDVLLVRKLGLPGQEELAMGAIADGGVRVLNDEVVGELRIPEAVVNRVAAAERRELERRARVYRGERPAPEVRGQTVIVVDDGLATGTTMRAAVTALRARDPGRIVVAVPVASLEALGTLRPLVDDLVCLLAPPVFCALGLWYADFRQTTDAEVCALLGQAAGWSADRQP